MRRAFYVTMRAYACMAFFCLFIAALVLLVRIALRRLRKKSSVGIAPFVLLVEVLVICFCKVEQLFSHFSPIYSQRN